MPFTDRFDIFKMAMVWNKNNDIFLAILTLESAKNAQDLR